MSSLYLDENSESQVTSTTDTSGLSQSTNSASNNCYTELTAGNHQLHYTNTITTLHLQSNNTKVEVRHVRCHFSTARFLFYLNFFVLQSVIILVSQIYFLYETEYIQDVWLKHG